MNVKASAFSVKGSRSSNEDSFLCADLTDDNAQFDGAIESSLFFLVADGMGGHDAGDVASAFVVNKMHHASKNASIVFDELALESLINSVHADLLSEAVRRGTPNMGSTLTGILLQKDAPCAFLNIGDSRVYRMRNGFMQQLSRDDSLADIMPGAAKNIITNAMGAGLQIVTVASRFSNTIAIPGDVFLMCSDGIHGFVNDVVLEKMLSENVLVNEIAERIVDEAIKNNSDDNCTALVVRIEA
jgi:protein phosphatase